MKSALVLILLAFSLAASAQMTDQAAIQPLLEMTTSNGTVSPKYQIRKSCQILADGVYMTSRTGGVEAKPAFNAIRWTAEISNLTTLHELIEMAAQGKVTYNPRPIGGSVDNYAAFVLNGDQKIQQVELLMNDGHAALNNSPATKTLVNLLRANCWPVYRLQ